MGDYGHYGRGGPEDAAGEGRYGRGDRYGGGGHRRGGRGRRGGGGGGDDPMGGGAEHLARIHGTEEDRVNCPFYFKIGACRHGDRCSRVHNRPVFSQTILVPHMYQNPASVLIAQHGDDSMLNKEEAEEEFLDFYEEVYGELSKCGSIEELNICDNLGDHMVGNVYVKFADEEEADRAQKNLYGRFYAGRPLITEFSPVTDFREARCRQFDDGTCTRGGYCNFMHIKKVPRRFSREMERRYRKKKEGSPVSRSRRERSRSGESRRRRRSRSKSRSNSRSSRHSSSRRHRSRSSRRSSRSRSPTDSKKLEAEKADVVGDRENVGPEESNA